MIWLLDGSLRRGSDHCRRRSGKVTGNYERTKESLTLCP